MKLISIHKGYLYSVKFEGEESDEFNRVIEEVTDVSAVLDFLKANEDMFDSYFGRYFRTKEEAAERIAEEADDMESYLDYLESNARNKKKPDYDNFFQYLNGMYKCDIKYIPMKAYGVNYRMSFIRLYAIKLQPNVYVVVDGGIKLGRTIQESPGLKETVLNKIRIAKEYLQANGIIDAEDMD